MLYQIVADSVGDAAHDTGVLEMSVLSARLAYASMCLALTWGVLTSMGWVNRLTGRAAMRSGHMILATLALAFAGMHFAALLLVQLNPWSLEQVLLPFGTGGKVRHAMGILAFEGMLVSAVVVGMKRWMSYWRWLWIHRLAYPAFGAGVVHSLLGAMHNGHIAALWLGGITLLVPALTITALRLVPPRALATTGLIEDAP